MSTIESTDGGVELCSRTEYDHRTRHETDGPGSLSVTVVTAVSEALDAEPMEVDPLYRSIDPDALDALFESTIGEDGSSARVSFTHDGCSVTVRGDGEVLVTLLDD